MSNYSDITSDGGMDPRNKLDDAMYRLTVQQRDTAWLELEAWKQRYLALSNSIAKAAFLHANPAITLMPEPESFKAGEMHGAAVERERICKAIKEEDDYCITEGDYMLDSDDCIAVARGEWERPDYSVDATNTKGQA